MMFKAIVTTEGLAKSIAPDIDPIELARPFITQMITERYSSDNIKQLLITDFQLLSKLAHSLPRVLPAILSDIKDGNLAVGIAPATLKAHHDAFKSHINTAVRAALTVTFLACGTYCLALASAANPRFTRRSCGAEICVCWPRRAARAPAAAAAPSPGARYPSVDSFPDIYGMSTSSPVSSLRTQSITTAATCSGAAHRLREGQVGDVLEVGVEEAGVDRPGVDVGDPDRPAAPGPPAAANAQKRSPALVPEYTAEPGTPSLPARLATLTTTPPGCISSAAARVSTIGAHEVDLDHLGQLQRRVAQHVAAVMQPRVVDHDVEPPEARVHLPGQLRQRLEVADIQRPRRRVAGRARPRPARGARPRGRRAPPGRPRRSACGRRRGRCRRTPR
jgi:hypothetical protein